MAIPDIIHTAPPWTLSANRPTLRQVAGLAFEMADAVRAMRLAEGADYLDAICAGNEAKDAVVRAMGFDPNSAELYAIYEELDGINN